MSNLHVCLAGWNKDFHRFIGCMLNPKRPPVIDKARFSYEVWHKFHEAMAESNPRMDCVEHLLCVCFCGDV